MIDVKTDVDVPNYTAPDDVIDPGDRLDEALFKVLDADYNLQSPMYREAFLEEAAAPEGAAGSPASRKLTPEQIDEMLADIHAIVAAIKGAS